MSDPGGAARCGDRSLQNKNSIAVNAIEFYFHWHSSDPLLPARVPLFCSGQAARGRLLDLWLKTSPNCESNFQLSPSNLQRDVVKLGVVEREPVSRPALKDRPTLGVIESISTGFDAVARHPWLMLAPLVLDLFLWIGPRLQAGALYAQFAPYLQNLPATLDADTQLAMQQAGQVIQEFFTKFNLFSWLSTGFLNLPTLNAGGDSTAKLVTGTTPAAWQIGDFGSYLLAFVVLNIIGLLIAALVWTLLTDVLRQTAFDLPSVFQRCLKLWGRLTVFVLAILTTLIGLLLVLSLLTSLIGLLSLGLAALIPLAALSFGLWVVFYLIFTVHGIVLYELPIIRSLRLSVVVIRLFFGPTLGLVFVSGAIYLGLGLIWDSFAIDSWARLIAMIGNAFIVTGLMMASLVFYQNRSGLLLDRLQAEQPIAAQGTVK
jgi:hypothetical protein